MRIESEKQYASGYQGDWGVSLGFTMATYAPMCWLHLFDDADDAVS